MADSESNQEKSNLQNNMSETGAEEISGDTVDTLDASGNSQPDAKARKSWTQSLVESLAEVEVEENVASMPVDRNSDRYNMKHSTRGKAVIFNHMKFSNGQSTRQGTDRDEKNLKLCLLALGFDVVVYNDLKRLQFYETIEKLQKMDHSEADCLVIVVLSHGEQDKIFCEDADYRTEELWNPFTADKCPTLAGKPKIFFIQACRGDQVDGGTKLLAKTSRSQTDSISKSDKFYRVPNRADFLIVYSTTPGYYSWRNTTEGSWFIQSLTKVIAEFRDEKDLLSMMTLVAREVALNFESNVPGHAKLDQKKQVPMISSTLIRDIYL